MTVQEAQCFLLVPTDRVALSLRRYVAYKWNEATQKSLPRVVCGRGDYGCDASEQVAEADVAWETRTREDGSTWRTYACAADVGTYKGDPRWPTHCACGIAFIDADEWQVFRDMIWRRVDTGEEQPFRRHGSKVPGAMWDASYWDTDQGYDGKAMHVICPGGVEWTIDGRASNCTLPNDKVHRCWLRTGEPPNLTVGKSGLPGQTTCQAGAGSIGTRNWHGFLSAGRLQLNR